MSKYEDRANEWASKWGVTLTVDFLGHRTHHDDDTDTRDVYRITLTREGRSMSFSWGQSLVHSRYDSKFSAGPYWRGVERKARIDNKMPRQSGNRPTMYDVIACLQKQGPGTFEQFCGDFGYDTDSRKALKTYLAVQQEAADFRRLCRDDVVIAEAEEIQ